MDEAVDFEFFTPPGQLENYKTEELICTFKKTKGKVPIEKDLGIEYVTPLGDGGKDNIEVPLGAFKRRKGKEVVGEGLATPYTSPHIVHPNQKADVPKSSYKRRKTSSGHVTLTEVHYNAYFTATEFMDHSQNVHAKTYKMYPI